MALQRRAACGKSIWSALQGPGGQSSAMQAMLEYHWLTFACILFCVKVQPAFLAAAASPAIPTSTAWLPGMLQQWCLHAACPWALDVAMPFIILNSHAKLQLHALDLWATYPCSPIYANSQHLLLSHLVNLLLCAPTLCSCGGELWPCDGLYVYEVCSSKGTHMHVLCGLCWQSMDSFGETRYSTSAHRLAGSCSRAVQGQPFSAAAESGPHVTVGSCQLVCNQERSPKPALPAQKTAAGCKGTGWKTFLSSTQAGRIVSAYRLFRSNWPHLFPTKPQVSNTSWPQMRVSSHLGEMHDSKAY